MSLFYVYVCVLCELFFSSIMLCVLLSYVNMCVRRVYFTINLLTYLLTKAHDLTGSQRIKKKNVADL